MKCCGTAEIAASVIATGYAALMSVSSRYMVVVSRALLRPEGSLVAHDKDVIIHNSSRALLICGQGDHSTGQRRIAQLGPGALRAHGAGGQALHRILCGQYQESQHSAGVFPCGSGVLKLVSGPE